MKKLNNVGFGVVEGILIVLIIALIGGAGFYVYKSQQKTNQSLDNANNTLNTIQKTKSAEKTPDKDPNEGYLVIKEWGLRFKVPSGLTDVRYNIHNNTTQGDIVAFYAKPTGSNVEYRSDYERMGEYDIPAHALGILYRSKESTKPLMDNRQKGKKLGDHYYYTAWSFSNLATGAGTKHLYFDASCDRAPSGARCDNFIKEESKAFSLMNEMLKTIELAQ